MIKEKNELNKEKNDLIGKEKNGITYRVPGGNDLGSSIAHNGQLLSSRKTPTFHRDTNNGRMSTLTFIQNPQSQTPLSKSNYLPSIYTSHANADSRLSEHGKKLI